MRPPIRIALCGAGMRGRSVWAPLISETEGVELAGAQDPSEASRQALAGTGLLDSDLMFSDPGELLDTVKPDALLVCSPHHTHAQAALSALRRGCHVLVEKPFVTDLGDGLKLVEEAEQKGLTLAVVQNWRTKSAGRALKGAIDGGLIGEVSHVFFRYLRDRELPTLPAYLFEEPYPLLYAVAVHHVDLFRHLFDCEVASVEARGFRPRWSRYSEPSGCHMWIEMTKGVVVSYAGTFSSRSQHYQWENLIIEGETGSLINESRSLEPPLYLSRRGEASIDLTAEVSVRDPAGQYRLADSAILENFRDAVQGLARPLVSGADNVGTIAALQACFESFRTGGRVDVSRLL